MKDKIVALLKQLGLLKDEDIQKVSAELDKLEAPNPTKVDTSKIADESLKQLVESLQSNLTILTQQNKELFQALANEKSIREKSAQLQADKLKEENQKKVSAAIQKLLDEGKISSDEEKQTWTKAFELDFDIATKQSALLSVKPGFKPKTDPKNPNPPAPPKDDDRLPSPLDSTNVGILKAVKEFAKVEN